MDLIMAIFFLTFFRKRHSIVAVRQRLTYFTPHTASPHLTVELKTCLKF